MNRLLQIFLITTLAVGCSRSDGPVTPTSVITASSSTSSFEAQSNAGELVAANSTQEQPSTKRLEESLQANYRQLLQDPAELENLISLDIKKTFGADAISTDFLAHVQLEPGSLQVASSGDATVKLLFQSTGRMYLAVDGTGFRASHFSVGAVDSMDRVVNVPDDLQDVGKLLQLLQSKPPMLAQIQVVGAADGPQALWEFCGITWSDQPTADSSPRQLSVECHEINGKFQIDLTLSEYLCSAKFRINSASERGRISNLSLLDYKHAGPIR